MPTMRWRELPPIPKALADDLEMTYDLLCREFSKDEIQWSDWIVKLLTEANRAVREAYESKQRGS